jgi:predicted metal-dependent phosphoesterase TrpH
MAVTDHDTTAALAEVDRAAGLQGIRTVTGIEVTAIEGGRDLHILGYLFDPDHDGLAALMRSQRAARVARIEAIAARLAANGVPIDVAPLLAQAEREPGRSIGRPQVARAMIAAGHVATTEEAFDRWLVRGRPGFVAREGPAPEAESPRWRTRASMASRHVSRSWPPPGWTLLRRFIPIMMRL